MSNPKTPLGRHLQVPIDDTRIDRGWEGVRARLPKQRRRLPIRGVAVAFALLSLSLFAIGLFLLPGTTREAVIEGAVLASSETEREVMELSDGSRLSLEPSTRLRLVHISPREVRLRLEEGAVDIYVARVENRPFSLLVDEIEVSVIGTSFRVTYDGDEVMVSVDEGRLALRGPASVDLPKTLGAGESWSSAAPVEDPEPVAPLEMPDLPDAGSPVSRYRGPSSTLPNRFHGLYGAGRYDDAYASVDPSRFERCIERGSARDLFALASAARLSGHSRPAARAFDALRKRHRKDARAGLAALELGRLRLYDLDDPRGAAEAFGDAIALQPSAFYREDAEARKVQALEAAGEEEACVEARDDYLRRFPSGLHAAAVARRCR